MLHSTFRQLEVFVLVVDEGSFAQAANRLGISQPGISKHIKALESQVGADLFERRRGREGVLTPEGQELYARATELLAIAAELAGSLAGLRQQRGRELRIGIRPHLVDRWIKPGLARFLEANPSVTPVFVAATNAELLKLAEDEKIDVALFIGYQPRTALRVEKLRDEPSGFYVAANHPCASLDQTELHTIAAYPFIMPPNALRHQPRVAQALKASGIAEIRTAFSTFYPDVVKAMTLKGNGVGWMTDDSARPEATSGRLVKLRIALPDMALYAVLAARRRTSRPVQNFLAWMRKVMRESTAPDRASLAHNPSVIAR